MKLQNKTIGIWGYGKVGKSAAQFCADRGARIIIWDDNPIECPYPKALSLNDFFAQCEKIIPSPGIDISQYYDQRKHKWLFELDLFCHFFTKKIIGITGSLGKTTVTTLLTQSLAQAGWRVQSAGNIGTPSLDIIAIQDEVDAAVLEVSSFQLEHCAQFAPDLAIWTNLFPNHLDRHRTMDQYFLAKLPLIAHQQTKHHAIIPLSLKNQIERYHIKSSIEYFSEIGIKQNKIIVGMALAYLTGTSNIAPSPALEHRLEYVATINGVDFINDSKSTTIQSTLAALAEFSNKRIVLFLGGLSKGVDRSPLIEYLSDKQIVVFCFGKEAPSLHELCIKHNLESYQFTNLQSAFACCLTAIKANDCILFSPAGSSYDLFKDYEDRGKQFKALVLEYQHKSS